MNGSDDPWPRCAAPGCRTEQTKAADCSYDHYRLTGEWYRDSWYCDACWAVLSGTDRIKALGAENERLSRRVVWFEGLLKPGLLTRIFRRFFTRRAYVAQMEEKLKTILAHAGSAIECVADCRSCWWQEGGRCYIGTPERLSDGRSTKMAEGRCDGYWNKRKALTTVIPGDKLVIASEEGEVPCPKCNPPAKLK